MAAELHERPACAFPHVNAEEAAVLAHQLNLFLVLFGEAGDEKQLEQNLRVKFGAGVSGNGGASLNECPGAAEIVASQGQIAFAALHGDSQ